MPASLRSRAALPLALLFSACSTTPPPPRATTPPTPAPVVASPLPATPAPATPVAAAPAASAPSANAAEQRTAAAATLTVEQQWLDSFFRGTPVSIRQLGDGTLAVDVPREFCFDAGKSEVKPPLAAVLGKVAESLRRRPNARVSVLSAPDDKPGSSPLALQRATQVQKLLRERGVPAARLGEPSAATAAAVQLRIVAAAS